MTVKGNKTKLKPTSIGWYFIGLVLILILLSISYSNNLLLIFSLLFLLLGIVWAVESFFMNKGITEKRPFLKDIFAGEKLSLHLPKGIDFCFLSSNKDEIHGGEVFNRGVIHINKVTGKTTNPFGLFEYSETVLVDEQLYIYPARVTSQNLLLSETGDFSGGEFHSLKNKEDLAGLSAYQEGNHSRIHWKYFAKTHELVMKDMEGNFAPETLLHLEEAASEEMLSMLAYEIDFRKKNHRDFILKIGDETISDYQEALRRLARW